jgi:hypothetical protein
LTGQKEDTAFNRDSRENSSNQKKKEERFRTGPRMERVLNNTQGYVTQERKEKEKKSIKPKIAKPSRDENRV